MNEEDAETGGREDAETGGRGDAETGGRGDAEAGGMGDGEMSYHPHPDPLPAGEGVPASTQNPEPEIAPQPELERLRGELEGVRTRGLESHRRALLAENAGRIVPELLAGSTVEELERSVEVARNAFEAARAAALAEMASTRVPAGNPVRQGPNVETMSPMEKIAHGLKRE